jgi:hypothetical protein
VHRSGTSALTRLFNLAGAFLPDKLMPPVPHNNERGFWEPVDLVAIDERALAAADVPWDSPRRIDPVWLGSEAAEHTVFELTRFFERTYAGQPLFVLKDPRLCRIVPLLRRALERARTEAAFVLSLRHPSAVAASLTARDGMPRDHGRALWLRYMLDAERYTRDAQRIVVGFEELTSDWRRLLSRVSRQLEVSLGEASRIQDAVEAFLEPQLVHHRSEDKDPLPFLIDEAWHVLLELQEDQNTSRADERLDRVWQTLEVADDVLGAAFSWEMKLRQREAQRLKAAERERNALSNELARVLEAQRTVAEALRAAQIEADAARARENQKAEHVDRLATLLRARDESVQSLRTQNDALRAQFAAYQLQMLDNRRALEAKLSRLNERIHFLQSMALANLEKARFGGKAAA